MPPEINTFLYLENNALGYRQAWALASSHATLRRAPIIHASCTRRRVRQDSPRTTELGRAGALATTEGPRERARERATRLFEAENRFVLDDLRRSLESAATVTAASLNRPVCLCTRITYRMQQAANNMISLAPVIEIPLLTLFNLLCVFVRSV